MAEPLDDWAAEARQVLMESLSPLAAQGKLNKRGLKGMVMSGVTVVEFVGEDGEDWHAIIGFPTERFRDFAAQHELLRRFVQNAPDGDDEDDD